MLGPGGPRGVQDGLGGAVVDVPRVLDPAVCCFFCEKRSESEGVRKDNSELKKKRVSTSRKIKIKTLSLSFSLTLSSTPDKK